MIWLLCVHRALAGKVTAYQIMTKDKVGVTYVLTLLAYVNEINLTSVFGLC